MLIDDITSISVNLGIVRIQGQKMNPEGILENVETIEIPAGKIGDIVNKLASGINELNEKVKEAQEAALKLSLPDKALTLIQKALS